LRRRTDGVFPYAEASFMSSDGSAMLGFCFVVGGSSLFRWSQASGMIGVAVPVGLAQGRWVGVTSDGAVAIGYAVPARGDMTQAGQVFRWTPTTGAVGLGTLPGATSSDPYGASSVGDLLASLGADLRGFTLFTVTVSPIDARLIMGLGKNVAGDVRGWFARLP